MIPSPRHGNGKAATELQGVMDTAEGEESISKDGPLTGCPEEANGEAEGIMLALAGGRAEKSRSENREVSESSHCCSSARGSF